MKLRKYILIILFGLTLGFAVDFLSNGPFVFAEKFVQPNWSSGLVGYWSFNGANTILNSTTTDSSGNNNNGTLGTTASVTPDTSDPTPKAGISGQALSFDGVNDYVNVPYSTSLNIATAITFEAWVLSRGIQEDDLGGIWHDQAVDTNNRVFVGTNGSLLAQYNIGGVVKSPTAPANSVPTNVWTHIVLTYDGSEIVLWVNGIKQTPVSVTGSIQLSTNSRWIGKGYSSTYRFNGLIDEVRIYNRALSAEEILEHYNLTKRNFVVNQPSGTPPVGWWKMDEGTGATVKDSSVNANNGTLYSGTTYSWSASGWTDGKIGKAFKFDGVDDYASATVSQVNTTAGEYNTVSFWMKWDGNSYRVIFDSGSHYDFYTNDGVCIGFNTGHVGDTYGFDTTGLNLVNQWHHVALLFYNGVYTNNKIYIDGTEQTLSQCVGSAYSATFDSSISIGRFAGGPNYYGGSLDDVRIYNYARSADQIAADYRAGAYRTIVGTSVPSNWWTNGLVGYWSFDGQSTILNSTTSDSSGNHNDGTLGTTASLTADASDPTPKAGISGQALSFDGVDDYVNAIDAPSLDNMAQLSVCAWIYPKASAIGVIVGKENSIYRIRMESARTLTVTLHTDNNAWANVVTSNTAMALNTWNFACFTYTSGSTIVYLNGKNDGSSASFTGDIFDGSGVLEMGIEVGSSWWFNGLIDEIRIYNRALSAEEVLEHYNLTKRNLKI